MAIALWPCLTNEADNGQVGRPTYRARQRHGPANSWPPVQFVATAATAFPAAYFSAFFLCL